MADAQSGEAAHAIEAVQCDVREPGRGSGGRRGGIEQRVGAEVRTLLRVGLAVSEVPPRVVGKKRLPCRCDQHQSQRDQARDAYESSQSAHTDS